MAYKLCGTLKQNYHKPSNTSYNNLILLKLLELPLNINTHHHDGINLALRDMKPIIVFDLFK
jgi:hypothetical protein